MSGGRSDFTIGYTKIEFLGNENLTIKFPRSSTFGPTVIVHKSELMVIAATYCFIFENGSWIHHSSLSTDRRNAIVVSMPRGIYVFGGHYSPYTSEFLPNGQIKWQEGPKIPEPGIQWLGGYGAPISSNELIIIIGCFTNVMKLNIDSQEWTNVENLLKGRCHQQYVLFKNKIIVCGGYYGETSTEIIDLSNGTVRKAGDLNVRRSMHGMDVSNHSGQRKVIAFGGFNANDQYLDSVEEWNDESETWKMTSLKLSEAKAQFRYSSHQTIESQPVSSGDMTLRNNEIPNINSFATRSQPSFVKGFLGLSLNSNSQDSEPSTNWSKIDLIDNFLKIHYWKKSLCIFPPEIMVKIFHFMDYNTLKSACRVCKNWKAIINEFKFVDKSSHFIILSGGFTNGRLISKTIEVLGPPQLSLPPLITPLRLHSMVISSDNNLLMMGNHPGATNTKRCVALKNRNTYSPLTCPRERAIGITMANGIYIFGGQKSPTTSDFLPNGKYNWINGPKIPGMGIQYGHGVATSPTTLVLIGGLNSDNQIISYDIELQEWTEVGSLIEGRTDHRCAFYNGKLVVTGGYDGWNELNSTEVHDLSRGISHRASDLNVARMGHGMGIIIFNGRTKLIAFGGLNSKQRPIYLDSVEEWDDKNEIWIMSTLKLSEGRSDFGFCSGTITGDGKLNPTGI